MFDRCWLWRRKLTRWADGALPARQWGALEDHLSRCKRCQAAAEADRALRAALMTHTGLLDDGIARRFDDRVVAKVAMEAALMQSGSYGTNERDPVTALAFLTQIVGGAFAAAALTAICLIPALHPTQGAGRVDRQEPMTNIGSNLPPVPLESLLETASPRAALLWTTLRTRSVPPRLLLNSDSAFSSPASATHHNVHQAPRSEPKTSAGADTMG